MPNKVWDEITYLLPDFTIDVWEWMSNVITRFMMEAITYSMLGSKLFHVSKRGHRSCFKSYCVGQSGGKITDDNYGGISSMEID